MAIRRYSKLNLKKIRINKKSNIFIRSNIVEISLPKNQSINDKISKLFSIVDFSQGDLLNVIYGNYEILILISGNHLDFLKKSFPKFKNKIKKRLASVTIKIPPSVLNIPGFYYSITKSLMLENISIIDIVNTRNEASIIVKENDIPKTFEKLSKEIIIEFFK